MKKHFHLTCSMTSLCTVNVCQNGQHLKFKVRKLNTHFGPTVLLEALEGDVTSAIDPDFKCEKIACR